MSELKSLHRLFRWFREYVPENSPHACWCFLTWIRRRERVRRHRGRLQTGIAVHDARASRWI